MREYLLFSEDFHKEKPWNCYIDIEHELAKTLNNINQFKIPKGEILLAVINGYPFGTESILFDAVFKITSVF